MFSSLKRFLMLSFDIWCVIEFSLAMWLALWESSRKLNKACGLFVEVLCFRSTLWIVWLSLTLFVALVDVKALDVSCTRVCSQLRKVMLEFVVYIICLFTKNLRCWRSELVVFTSICVIDVCMSSWMLCLVFPREIDGMKIVG